MGGGGGGGLFTGRSLEQIAKLVENTEDITAKKEFETKLSGILNNLLSEANSRDVEKVADRLDQIKAALGDELEKTVDTLFGGSVAKHTYVDGLSDVDSLLVLNGTELDGVKPSTAIAKVRATLQKAIGDTVEVTAGKLAVTIRYGDGMEIQVLPAFQTDGGLKVPSFRKDGWSNISPETFQSALTKTNNSCAGKLIPTIKLAKAVISTLPEAHQLSGYHVESLAIAAFKGYSGVKTTSAMLPVLFEKAKKLISSPIKDSTGQSVHVDGYLGAANSIQRSTAGHIMERISKRMRNASTHQSSGQWKSILGIDND